MKTLLLNEPKHVILARLKELYRSKTTLTREDLEVLNAHETFDYDFLGIIGLLIKNKARIALGQKQPFEHEIQKWCEEIDIKSEDFEIMADKYLDDNYEEEPEYVLRMVMLEYPYKGEL